MAGIFLTGAGGYVGAGVVAAGAGQHEIHAQWRTRRPPDGAASHHRLDLDDRAALTALLGRLRPEVVIHAAYDMAAGAEPNRRWSRNVFAAAAEAGARILFVSTDLVFDGQRGWYREEDRPAPTLDYGRWKAELEPEVLALDGLVARTALVWSLDPVSENVERLVLDPLRRGESPRLFEDEWRTPTELHDLAAALLAASQLRGRRVLHLAGPERITRLDLGRLIARRFGYDPASLPPFRRDAVAPDRPRDTSLLVTSTRDVIPRRFRGPSELLA